jgi:hypothetical protein
MRSVAISRDCGVGNIDTIIYLTKASRGPKMLPMDVNYLDRLGLGAAEADGRIFRKSRLMLASNFLVGTVFNSSRFCFSSMEHSL